uniref:Uncharacterized protein n=1 Tax=Plectus sambesii TaxID=2011161 RepID=A0A914W8H1_9BILA
MSSLNTQETTTTSTGRCGAVGYSKRCFRPSNIYCSLLLSVLWCISASEAYVQHRSWRGDDVHYFDQPVDLNSLVNPVPFYEMLLDGSGSGGGDRLKRRAVESDNRLLGFRFKYEPQDTIVAKDDTARLDCQPAFDASNVDVRTEWRKDGAAIDIGGSGGRL